MGFVGRRLRIIDGDASTVISTLGRMGSSAVLTRLDTVGRRVLGAVLRRTVTPLLYRYERARDVRFDAEMNIETCAPVHLDELTIEGENTDFGDDELIYVGLPVRALDRMTRHLRDDLSEFTFVDFGSGKGRALFFAAQFGYRRIVGVEFAVELHEQAVDNIRSSATERQVCCEIESVLVDATGFEIPDGPCVLFFFNPFEAPVMAQVAAKIKASFEAKPRELVVAYYNPVWASVIEALGIFELVHRSNPRLMSECYDVAIYRAEPTRQRAVAIAGS